jgi:hypothetical protein
VAQDEPAPPIEPAAGSAAFYLVAHHQAIAASPAPAGRARLGQGQAPTPRFVEPACP